MLDLCVDLLQDIPAERIVVVDHNSALPVKPFDGIHVIRDEGEANISRLWNLGLDFVDDKAWDSDYHVAVLNDDLRIPIGTLPRLSEVLTETKATISFPDQSRSLAPGAYSKVCQPGPYNLHYRMAGYCWLLHGNTGLRLDENFVWWYGDDDIEWRAAELGGVVRVGGVHVDHLNPNGSTNSNADLAKQTAVDRQAFVAKWKKAPW